MLQAKQSVMGREDNRHRDHTTSGDGGGGGEWVVQVVVG